MGVMGLIGKIIGGSQSGHKNASESGGEDLDLIENKIEMKGPQEIKQSDNQYINDFMSALQSQTNAMPSQPVEQQQQQPAAQAQLYVQPVSDDEVAWSRSSDFVLPQSRPPQKTDQQYANDFLQQLGKMRW